jgi:Yip1 domain
MDTPLPDPRPGQDTPTAMSLVARLMNIYATPGDVFESVRLSTEPSAANWLVPVFLSCLAGILFTWIAFSQPNVEQQIRERQDQKLQQMVDSGKMSAADAEAARAKMEQINLMTLVKVAGAAATVVTSFALVFVMGLVLKLTAYWRLKQSLDYMKLVEVAGLSGMVLVLGSLVYLLLVVITGSIYATPGPVLLVGDIDPQNKLHMVLSSISVMTLWYLCVLGIGLAKLAGSSFGKAVTPLIALWVLVRAAVILAGWASNGMIGAG